MKQCRTMKSSDEDKAISKASFHRVGATFLLDTDAEWISVSQMQNFVCMQYFEILKQV